MDDDILDDEPLPPLTRPGVAPLWRLVAIFSLLGAALLLSMVLVLWVALAHQGGAYANNNWGGVAAPAVAAGPAVAADNDDGLDPANPAYPLAQDLRPDGTFPLPADADLPPENPAPSPRRRFLKAAEGVVWTSSDPEPPDRVLVSPDGMTKAYAVGEQLMVGPPIGEAGPVDQLAAAGGMGPRGKPRGGMVVGPGQAPKSRTGAGPRAVLSGWSADGTAVCWVSEGGRVCRHDMPQNVTTRRDVRAEAALPLPGAGERLVAVRRQPRAKADVAGDAARDLTEVAILAGAAGNVERVLIPAGPARWHSPALSPDGKRLALVRDRHEKPADRRVVILSLEGNEPKPEPVSPPAARVEGVCWTSDGKALLYARSQSAAPGDHATGTPRDACDLFLLDLETKKETRLSRGGGFLSPSVTHINETHEDWLFFLAELRAAGAAPAVELREVPLKKVRDFAEDQEKEERDQAKVWKELAVVVLKEAGVSADSNKGSLSPGAQQKIAEAFTKTYPNKFNADAPATAATLERQRREVAALDLTPNEQIRFAVLLGAIEGEYLRGRQQGSAWHSAKELSGDNTALAAENPFGFVFNPFRPLRPGEKADKDGSPQSLAEVLYRAAGRPIVLSNDGVVAKEALANLVDGDLARGSDLLRQGKGDEADGVLLKMMERHPGNNALTVHVGSLLQQHGRAKALDALCQPRLRQLDTQGVMALPRDARLLNLLGVALLGADEADASKAITVFKTALRCDLNYGPAYLNLAGAYEQVRRKADARLCLRRYLKLFPNGEWAEDARRRLTAAGDD